ncbi:CarD family transcriptional regulator [uncultured Clostridium sp.]|uniref:CarD family transcriptional regulator n=1 Tax=uncultured Clostridium sp. TaxID=59620 RepID=UPI0025EBD33D|nr:CarD family transcriptional regulator [uncultured Clostridium sp.]
MFKVDDYIIYGGNGVCRVADIGVPEISRSDIEREYYTLEPIYESGRIFAPVDNEKIVMRKVITKEEAENIIENIPSVEVNWIDDMKERENQFKDIIHHYDCSGFVKIIKTLLERKKKCASAGKKMSTSDANYLKKAKEYLCGEFAIALNIPKDNVDGYIKERLKSM